MERSEPEVIKEVHEALQSLLGNSRTVRAQHIHKGLAVWIVNHMAKRLSIIGGNMMKTHRTS